MAITRSCRPAVAVLLSLSLFSLTCVAQPLAEPGSQRSTKQFPEDQPGFPQYPSAQSGSQTGATQYPEDQPGFPQYPTSQPANQRAYRPPAAQPAGSASVNFPPDRNDSVALQCDQLADQPSDPLRIGNGVVFDKDTGRSSAARLRAGCRAPTRTTALSISLWPRPGCGQALSRGSRAITRRRTGLAMPSHPFPWGISIAMALACRKTRNKPCACISRAGNAGIADGFAAGGEIYLDENPPDYVRSEVLARALLCRAARLTATPNWDGCTKREMA